MSCAFHPSTRYRLSSLLLASILLGGCAGTLMSERQIPLEVPPSKPSAAPNAPPGGTPQQAATPVRSQLVVPTLYQGQAPSGQTAGGRPATVSRSGAVNVDISGDISRSYMVFGQEYYVLRDAAGYQETGTASWYGPNFHGKQTASGEIYNQYGISAAHRTLPLNSHVWVVNLRNNRAIEVRINDRGPFAKNRLIDLSYGAAWALDIVSSGTAPVFLKVASQQQIQSFGTPVQFDARAAKDAAEREGKQRQEEPGEIEREQQGAQEPDGEQLRTSPRQKQLAPPDPGGIRHLSPPPLAKKQVFFVQLGAWSSRENAERNFDLVRESFSRVLLSEKPPKLPGDVLLHRLLLGPYKERSEAQEVLELMKIEGFEGAFIPHSSVR